MKLNIMAKLLADDLKENVSQFEDNLIDFDDFRNNIKWSIETALDIIEKNKGEEV